MSNFNKVVTNIPVSLTETEMSNLSQTLSGIIQGGGGGGEGKRYIGDGVYVTVNNDANPGVISLTQTSLDKLNKEIPSAVSSFPDSIQYAKKTEIPDSITDFADTGEVIYSYIDGATSALESQINTKQNKLQFDLNAKGEISAIGPLYNTTALAGANGITGDYYSASNPSGFINSTQAETQILAKNYITSGVSELDNFYSKTDTSSKTELQTKFDSLLDYNVTAAAGIKVTTATDVGIKTFGISMTAQPVVTDTRLSGYNGIAAEPDGNVSGLWDVGLTQDMLNTINGKLDSTVAAQTYQPKGDYVSSTDITDMATKTWVEQKNYLTQVPSEYITDTELQATLVGYATNTLVQNTSATITSMIPSTEGLASETDLQIVSAGVDYVSAHAITAHQSLTNYYTKSETSGATQLSTEFGKYLTKTIADGYYYPLSTNPSNYATSAGLTQSKQYAMTTTGWSEITGGGSTFTGVTTASPITGDGLNNTLGLDSNYKTAIEQVSGKVDKPADMTSNIPYCFSAGQWADITQTYYSKTEATGTFLQKHLTNTLSGDGTSNNTLGVNWSNLSSNLINSANTASNAWISGTEFSSFAQIKTAIDSKQSASDYVHISGDTMTGGLTISASSGKNVLAVASAASLLGASRQTSANYGVNDTALGTTWMGVGGPGMYRGFLKYTQGGNVGDLDTDNTMQVEFTPNNKGTIFAKAKNNGTDCPETQILNPVKTTCDNMSASGIDANNMSGPNYMIAKNADGQFVIGAAVFNCQNNLPGTLQPNTYYFVY